jgi:hypothetical protein
MKASHLPRLPSTCPALNGTVNNTVKPEVRNAIAKARNTHRLPSADPHDTLPTSAVRNTT